MEQIQHKYVEVNGLKLHVAEVGAGDKVAVFLHGFPEIWYSWRHQMIAAENAGYRAIAPDFREYGLSDHPLEPEKASKSDFTDDILGILDALNILKAFMIGKDFGAWPAYYVALLHLERVSGVITMGVPFVTPGPVVWCKDLPEGLYISRWRVHKPFPSLEGTEADFGRFDAKTVCENIYIMFSRSEIPIAAENQEIMDVVDPSTPLPSWFTEEDLENYGAFYGNSGFRTALQVPYCLDEELKLPGKCETPSMLIKGEKDYLINFPGMEGYITSGMVKTFVPNLEVVYMPEGNHFLQEQFPEEVNKLVLTFLNKHV